MPPTTNVTRLRNSGASFDAAAAWRSGKRPFSARPSKPASSAADTTSGAPK
ncbi:hypothetical protein BgramDRAFT_6736 [Paraburkholderia graminis C4D1M]|uniref:Uncharacterized protein n=1 Tax=Paraburkholderia graminis (strain ATCC 700544 / DSM 17151 / LMG 18924 / NCIMB 13744 / C4D1M) TaxID=396598 RepID=B1GBJ9_PARG4|nr:hypothetical protein BgramDRAFT_6736 [Paraburkholderia graminis C4D1M]